MHESNNIEKPEKPAGLKPHGFTRAYSLKRNKDFRFVYKSGKPKTARTLVLYYRRSRAEHLPKIGISVSKKLGNSVTRNRVKRRIRAALSPYLDDISRGSRLIFIARAPVLNESFASLGRTVERLLQAASVLEPRGGTAQSESESENIEERCALKTR